MIYREFLEETKLDIQQVTLILGYSKKSVYNNWKKDNQIPEIALKTLNYYLELKKEQEVNSILNKKIEILNSQTKVENKLSKEALEIATKKAIDNNIRLEDYLSSLVLANV